MSASDDDVRSVRSAIADGVTGYAGGGGGSASIESKRITATWCEGCRDYFDVEHYNDNGHHKVGAEWGPLGRDLRIVELATKVIMSSTPFSSAWEFNSMNHDVDAEDFHRELRELLGISIEDWRDSPDR